MFSARSITFFLALFTTIVVSMFVGSLFRFISGLPKYNQTSIVLVGISSVGMVAIAVAFYNLRDILDWRSLCYREVEEEPAPYF